MDNSKLPIAILLLLLLSPVMSKSGNLEDPIEPTSRSSNTIRDYIDFESQSFGVFGAIKPESNLYQDSSLGIGQSRQLKISFDKMSEKDRDSRAYMLILSPINPGIAALPKYLLWYGVNRPESRYAIFAGQIMRIRDYQLIQSTYGRANSPRLVRDADKSAMGLLFAGNLTKEMSRQIALNFQLGYREMQNSYQQDRLGNVIMLDRSLVRKYPTGTFWEVSLSYRIFGQ
jgi:hypothetical protein